MEFQIHTWFPTAIYAAENIITSDYNNQIKNESLKIFKSVESGADNWNCNTFNTLGSYDLKQNTVFDPLIKEIEEHLDVFVRHHNSKHKYKCRDGWLNMNLKNTYQEYHSHAESTFSAVYYISTPLNSGKIIFQNPTEPDMLPIKAIENENELTYKKCFYQPTERTLLIFRSYLRHMVEMGTNEEPRITAAFNF